ncbi:MAG: hypothetical protein MUO62_03855 [Anaerolineales bacterium]|jgi:hypothetical protein|nr:hypothetical protein [Anaerolineales bacterium]
MSNYSLLLDVAKARNAELVREVAMTRLGHEFKRNQKPIKVMKKLRMFLSSLS